MSLMRCSRHDLLFDTNWIIECPACEREMGFAEDAGPSQCHADSTGLVAAGQESAPVHPPRLLGSADG